MGFKIDVNIYPNQHIIEAQVEQSKSKKKPEVDSKTQVFKNQISTDSEQKDIPLKSALKKKKVQWKENQSIRMYKGENWMQTSVTPKETVREIAKEYELIQKDKRHSHHDTAKNGSHYLTLEQIADLGHYLPKMNKVELKQFYRNLYIKAWAAYQLNDQEALNFVDHHLQRCLSRVNDCALKEIHSDWHKNVLAANQSGDQEAFTFANHYFQQATSEIKFRVQQTAIQSRHVQSKHR